MKIALIDELHQIKKVGGTYHSTELLKKYLSLRGHQVDVLSINRKPPIIEKLLTIPNFREVVLLPFWNRWIINKKQYNYDLIVCQTTTSLLWLKNKNNVIIYTRVLLARQLKIIRKLRINPFLRILFSVSIPIIQKVEKQSLKKAKKILTPKKQLKKYIIEIGIEPNSITVAPQMMESLPQQPSNQRSLTRKYDLIYVGRTSIPKNFQIVKELAEKFNYSVLALSSEKQTKHFKNISFCSASRQNISSYYGQASIMIIPSHAETGPLVALEAMSCGLPIVCSPEGAGDFVQSNINGIVITTNKVENYNEAIKQILYDEELRKKISRQNIDRAKKYLPETMIDRYLKIFINAVEKK